MIEHTLPPSCPLRGLSRPQGAEYVGVGVRTFDKLVADGRMPHPKSVGTRKIRDRVELDAAFDELDAAPTEGASDWDAA